ncbi:MAG: hypothetical protein ACT4ON_13880 [Bacteroidota bacterium]
MKSTDKLFRLIKAMSPNEKGYFKKTISNSATSENKLYLLLFDTIEKKSQYNEKEIKQKLKNKELVNNFSSSKKYLYQMILKTLNAYSKGSSVINKINESISYSKILFSKMLYKDALKVLDNAHELALKYEKHLLLLEIAYTKKYIREFFHDKKKLNKSHENYLEQRKIWEAYNEIIEYSYLDDKSVEFAPEFYNGNYSNLKPLLSSPLLGNKYVPHSIFGNILKLSNLLFIKGSCNAPISDLFPIITKFETVFDENKEILVEHNMVMCILFFHNASFYFLKNRIDDKAEYFLNRMESARKTYKYEEVMIFLFSVKLHILFYMCTLNNKKGIQYYNDVAEEFDVKKQGMNPQHLVSTYLGISFLFYINKQYDKAFEQIQKAYNDRLDHRMVMSFSLRCLYELEEYDQIEDLIPKLKKEMEGRGEEQNQEYLFIEFLQQVITTTSVTEKRKQMLNFLTKLESRDKKLIDFETGKAFGAVLDYRLWIKSKLEKTDYIEVLKISLENKPESFQ